jgi:glycosyltransferase involved in cell wall biosynthesis
VLRVLLLIKGLGPGGAERLLVHQARCGADDIAYEVAYLVPGKDQLVGELAEAGVSSSCLGAASSVDPRWLVRLRRRLGQGDVDVVHVHSPLVASGTRLVVRALPARRRPALVYTEHNRWEQYEPLTRHLNHLTYGLDDWQLAVSGGVRDSIHRSRRARVQVLVHGIDVAAVAAGAAGRDEVRASWGVGPETVVVGTVANLRTEKAYPDLVDAAGRVVAASPGREVVFVAIGQGPLEAEIGAAVRSSGLGDRFRLLGYRPDATSLMAGFDLFVLASHHEGLPVALMEAQALGLPVVATAVGGVPEAVEHEVSGLLVEPGQPAALAAAVLTLAGDPGRRARMGEAAREQARRFDAAAATATIEDGYRRLVAARADTDGGR